MPDTPQVRGSRFEAEISMALTRRGHEFLKLDDLAGRVSALEPLEAYFIVKEIGVEDAAPLVKHATQEQLRAFIDLDCWRGDHFDPVELDAWLTPFASEGPAALASAFCRLDEEVQTLFCISSLTVYDLQEPDRIPAPKKDVVRKTTPDGYYAIEAKAGVEREVDPLFLAEALYARDLELGFRLVTAARWELPSPLEEQALQFRTARLSDLGFLPREEALSIFAAPADPARDRPPKAPGPTQPTTLPALYAVPLSEGALLTRALSRVRDPALLDAVQNDLVHLINRAVVAYHGSPGDLRSVTEMAKRVRDTASLGMECVLSPDAPLDTPEDDAAAALLDTWSVLDLFRRGYQEVLLLQRAARALLSDPVIQHWRDRSEIEQEDHSIDRSDREFVNALLDAPPLWGGFDPLKPELRKAFGNKRELEEAAARVEQIHDRLCERVSHKAQPS